MSSAPAPLHAVSHGPADAIVVGAGVAGLAAALRLSHAGLSVLVLERHGAPGGRMRTLPSPAGPVDAGPTVLTMRPVFEALFADVGERLEDHLTLHRQHLLARHFWPDGAQLDLFDDEADSAEAVRTFAGARAARQFTTFCARARKLFEAFDAPMMQAPAPSLAQLGRYCAARPWLLPLMAPGRTLAGLLESAFDDPRLAQLFGRYATYVGGSPYGVPALLALIWHAEACGVWVVEGGMHRLAQVLAERAEARGARFHYNAHVAEIDVQQGRACGVRLADGTRIAARQVLFNGDPRALATGAMGAGVAHLAPQTATTPRSLSAEVWAFAATPRGPELAHHNVFFRDTARPEFDALSRGALVDDPTLYICAMDRGLPQAPPALERFEIIANAPPLGPNTSPEEASRCQTRTFHTLERFGLSFSPEPGPSALTTPRGFESLFPATGGALYGQSPEGMMAAFQRPTARSGMVGLYLAGGGAHPGAGVPMATLSARHAAEAMLNDRTSTSPSRQTATRGGMSTGSAPAAPARSASSRS
ncbi:MAG: phytoene desaturase family protein [Roseovarius sp.]